MKTIPHEHLPVKTVGIWIRVSTEDQAQGESPERHEARARLYAEAKGWNVKEVYHLEGVSGKSVTGHAECRRMLADVRGERIQALIFSKLARLARNTKELLEFADIFRDCNCDLVSLQESIDTSSPAGRLFYTMIAAMAQWEREETVERVKASVVIRAKLGTPLGGSTPFGYHWKDKKLVPHPQEAPVRKLMYELFLQHRRKKTVVRLLNEAGHRTRKGARFTSKTVSRLLQDPTAKGIHLANHTTRDAQNKKCLTKPEDQWVTHKIEPIVTVEIWDQCNRIIEATHQNHRPPAKKTVHLFAGIAQCTCGMKMYVPSNSPKYLCRGCHNKIPIDDLEEIFIGKLKQYSLAPDEIRAYLDNANQTLREKVDLLRTQEHELEKVTQEIARTYKLYQEGQLDSIGFGRFYKPLEERRKQLEASAPKIQAEIDVCKVDTLSVEEVVTAAQNLSQHWPSLDTETKRTIIEGITEKIVISKDDVIMTLCNMPVPDSGNMAKRWRRGRDLNPRYRI